MKILSILSIFSIILSLSSCTKFADEAPSVQYYLKIKNDRNFNAYAFLSYNYPDTSLPIWGTFQNCRVPMAGENSINSIYPWQTVIKKNTANTLILFLVNEDTLFKYGFNEAGWTTIRDQNNIKARKYITIKDIDTTSGSSSTILFQ